jgi:flagellin-like hook-associated protein FlgL
MGSIPANLSRVPTVLSSQLLLGGITSANLDLARVQEQMSTLKRVNRPSDDPIAAALINVLDKDLETNEQINRNLTQATGVLNVLDQRIGELNDLVLEAQTISSAQVGVGSDTATREQQSYIIDALIDQLFSAVNADYAGLSLFAGSESGSRAVETFGTGYRYMGDRGSLRVDIGQELDFGITLAADDVVGALSAQVEGDVDLNATLQADTKLTDLRGPMQDIDSLGTIAVTIDTGTPMTISVDLSDAETAGDVATMIESAIRDQGPPGVLAGGFGAGVTLSQDRFRVNLAGGGTTVTFSDGPVGESAEALGLSGHTYALGTETNLSPTADLNPATTRRTRLGDLNPAQTLDFSTPVLFRNGNASGTVTLSPGMTVGEFAEEVQRLDLGIRLEIDDSLDHINVVNEVSGTRLSVGDVNGSLATRLGIHSFKFSTELSVFNDGRGVVIADGQTDENGLPDASRNVDFEIELSDGTTFSVDLTPADTGTVADVIARINSDAVAAGVPLGSGPGQFVATISNNGNGILLQDAMGGAGAVTVRSLNGYAAEDLGLLDGTSVPGNPATLTGEDRATVRVNSLFTTLLDLRDALATDDTRGITFAGELLEADLDRLSSARALVGGRTQRVEASQLRLEDRVVMDQSIKSDLQDLDLFEASSRFTLLEVQLQATLAAASQSVPLSLLNFL